MHEPAKEACRTDETIGAYLESCGRCGTRRREEVRREEICTADINIDRSIDCSDYGRLTGNGIGSGLVPTTALVAAVTGTLVSQAAALSRVSTVYVRTELRRRWLGWRCAKRSR